jgi:hypothetical protein
MKTDKQQVTWPPYYEATAKSLDVSWRRGTKYNRNFTSAVAEINQNIPKAINSSLCNSSVTSYIQYFKM